MKLWLLVPRFKVACWPAKSRKFRTFAGFAMPEITKPMPKMSPAANWTRILTSASDQVADQEHGRHGGCHENGGRHDGASGQPGDAADTVTAGAASAIARADSYQLTGQRNA